jgi:hypothetical protein
VTRASQPDPSRPAGAAKKRAETSGDISQNAGSAKKYAQKLPAEVGQDARVLAALLTATPNLRARLFADPTRQAGTSLPPAKYWSYRPSGPGWLPWNWYGSPFRYRLERAALAKRVLDEITSQVGSDDKGQGITASVSTDSVFEEYFAPIVKVSQRSFTSVFYLSIAAFIAGLSLIGIGSYIAIVPHAGTNSTVVASIFGGSGAISALGAVYAMATRGIREATLDHARVRLVLTAFATQLGQLRAIIETPPRQDATTAQELNDAIGKSMNAALAGIPSPVEIAAKASSKNGVNGKNKSPKTAGSGLSMKKAKSDSTASVGSGDAASTANGSPP